jgi:[protein-PII] uridylyltransferase
MVPLPAHRRRIVARAELGRRLAALPITGDGASRRAASLDLMRRALADGRAEVGRRFEEGGDGLAAAHALSYLFDQLLRVLFDDTVTHVYPTPNPTQAERLTVVAVGGWGRAQMAPHSDLDILFLRPWKSTPRAEQVVEHMLYLLWDLGLKVGHATRNVDECLRAARDDVTVRTALLEARWVWGEQDLWLELARRFQAEIVAGNAAGFVQAKIEERDQRHSRLGDSRYVLEPNIKDGKGGLRDLHTLGWIARFTYGVRDLQGLVAKGVLTGREARRFTKAERFLWDLRWHLHLAGRRADERLGFDLQSALAERMGYTDHAGTRGVERFMKHYFLVAKEVGDLSRLLCGAVEASLDRRPRLSLGGLWRGFRRDLAGFRLDADRLVARDQDVFGKDPLRIMRLFKVSYDHDVEIHPRTLRQVSENLKRVDRAFREDPEANRLFLDILAGASDPEHVLRRMNEVGLFGRFVPDFGRVVAQMQYDMYHVYTVDEHTLFAIGILHRIEEGKLADDLPLATGLFRKIVNRRALYVAILLHDIAKGRGGDHSEHGEKIAQRMGPRFGLDAEETRIAAWLVRWHLAMSNTAFKRDLTDPRTIDDFVGLVETPERLRLLLLLTVADIRAVGPKVWNNWKAGLLRDLYMRAEDRLTGGFSPEALEAAAAWGDAPLPAAGAGAARREAVAAQLRDWPAERVAAILDLIPARHLAGIDTAAAVRQARMIHRADGDAAPLAVDTRVDLRRGVTDVTILAPDELGLFAKLAGAIAGAGASIVDARITTLVDGRALDSFLIQDAAGGALERPERLARLAVAIEQAVSAGVVRAPDVPARRAAAPKATPFAVQPRVLIDNDASANATLIEVNGRDRPGLLHELTATLSRHKLQIGTAKVSTFGERVVDVFYVKDVFGLKLDQPQRLADLRQALLEVLAEPAAQPETAAPRRRRRRAA